MNASTAWGEREPPSNIEAEQSLLGAILMANSAFDAVTETLKPHHFAVGIHGRIYAAIDAAITAGQTANGTTLHRQFDGDPDLRGTTPAAYFARLVSESIGPRYVKDYAKVIVENWKRRALIDLGRHAQQAAADQTHDADAERIALDIAEGVDAILLDGQTAGALKPAAGAIDEALEAIQEAYRTGGKVSGVLSGLTDVDAMLGAFQPGTLVLLGARPGMGKSSLAINFAMNAARAGHFVPFFSLEMKGQQIMQFALAEATAISADRQRKGQMNGNDVERLFHAGQAMKELPLMIDERSALTVGDIRAQVRSLKRKRAVPVVMIDYLQLLRSTDRAENRNQEITKISMNLLGLAKDENTCVIALSQLSRDLEKREDKRPQLSDLRESGSLEQDAHVIMFLHREEYWLERNEPDTADHKRHAEWTLKLDDARGKCEVNFAKNRMGPVGRKILRFEAEFCRFRDWRPGQRHDEQMGDLG